MGWSAANEFAHLAAHLKTPVVKRIPLSNTPLQELGDRPERHYLVREA